MPETTSPPSREARTEKSDSTAAQPSTRRLIGLDIARGLAVLGMFASHTGAASPGTWLATVVDGKSAALFAVLAGVSLSLLSGGPRALSGTDLRAARVRIATRAVIVFFLGLTMTTLSAPAMVILAFYGVLFLLSIPLLRLRTTALATTAAIWAVAGPVVSFFVRQSMETPKEMGAAPTLPELGSLGGLGKAAQDLLLTGAYPVLTWFPFVLAGMAIGRLNLRSTAVRGWLTGLGAALGVLGYGLSWLLVYPLGGMDHIVALFGGQLPPQLVELVLSSNYGTVPTMDPIYLITSGAHSGTPFEVVGAAGCALAVIGIALAAGDRFRVLLAPLAGVGALALTCYVGHLIALGAYGVTALQKDFSGQMYVPWLVLVAVALVVAPLWRRFVGRGPLEWALHRSSTGVAALVKR